MKLIRYWCRKGLAAVYLAAALLMALLFAWQAGAGMPCVLPMTALSWCFMLMLRTADDCFDYEQDRGRKKQYLRKNQLLLMLCVLGAVLVLLHLWFFGMPGLICLAAVGYIPLMNRFPVIKPAFLPLLFAMYDLLTGTGFGLRQAAVFAAMLMLAGSYALYKRKSE
ncbi:MAG: hypothetical protein IJ060_03700 [Oscillospiraceae bacterium]|nr:hypothetical protein [Oscillospiraceae bacterium]